jgi:large subunit ribosomal protein L18
MSAIKDMKFRRRAESVTDYRKRLGLVKSGLDRIVVRKSNRRIMGQVVRYSAAGDVVVAHADSSELEKMDWVPKSNRPTAYLTGLLLARKAGKEASSDHILDIGLTSPVKNSIPFVFAKGCMDGGLKLRSSIKIDEKVYNCSETKYIAGLKSSDAEKYKNHYTSYTGAFSPEGLAKAFAQAKEKVMNATRE